MTLRSIVEILDNSGIVVYSGWHSDVAEPIFEWNYGGMCYVNRKPFATFLAQHGDKKVCALEAVGDALYVWIEEEEK